MVFFKRVQFFFTFLLVIGVQITVVQASQIEGFISAIDAAAAKKPTTAQQISFVQGLNNLLTTPAFTTSTYANRFSELQTYTKNKILILQGIQSLSKEASPVASGVKPSGTSVSLSIKGVNTEKVRNVFLDWHNQERQSLGLTPYSYHSELERSAHTRSENLCSEERTTNTHTRYPDTKYYDVKTIKNWFGEQGISFADDTFSESVGRGYYKCEKADCTDDLINAVRSSWEFFMSEKGKGGSHYKAIASKSFSQIGVGISVDSARKRYYLVVHYGTDILS